MFIFKLVAGHYLIARSWIPHEPGDTLGMPMSQFYGSATALPRRYLFCLPMSTKPRMLLVAATLVRIAQIYVIRVKSSLAVSAITTFVPVCIVTISFSVERCALMCILVLAIPLHFMLVWLIARTSILEVAVFKRSSRGLNFSCRWMLCYTVSNKMHRNSCFT